MLGAAPISPCLPPSVGSPVAGGLPAAELRLPWPARTGPDRPRSRCAPCGAGRRRRQPRPRRRRGRRGRRPRRPRRASGTGSGSPAYCAPSRARASSASACRARSRASSSSRAVSGTTSAMKVRVGTNLMPVCLPTVERSTPVALASARADSSTWRRVAVDGVEDRRLAEVAGHLGVGDGHHAQAGVLDLHLDRGGDDLSDAHRQLAGAGRVGHRTSSEKGAARGVRAHRGGQGQVERVSRRCRRTVDDASTAASPPAARPATARRRRGRR